MKIMHFATNAKNATECELKKKAIISKAKERYADQKKNFMTIQKRKTRQLERDIMIRVSQHKYLMKNI